jgi:hypothetical protein
MCLFPFDLPIILWILSLFIKKCYSCCLDEAAYYASYCHVFGVSVTNNTGFWIGWSDLLALLYNFNQWLSTTRSIPYWTLSVFSSSVTNDERRIIAHILNSLNDVCLTNALWRISRDWNLLDWTNFHADGMAITMSYISSVIVCFTRYHETCVRLGTTLWFPYVFVAAKRVPILWQRFDFCKRVRCYEKCF